MSNHRFCCCGSEYEIGCSLTGATEGNDTPIDNPGITDANGVLHADAETAWTNLLNAARAVLDGSGTPGEVTLGRYFGGGFRDADFDHYDITFRGSFADKVNIEFDTSSLSGLTITSAKVRIAESGMSPNVLAGVVEDFDFGLFETDGTQHGGDRNTGGPTDVAGYFEIAITDPDTVINKAGTTTLQLWFLSDPTTGVPSGYTFSVYADNSYAPTLTYSQACQVVGGDITLVVRAS